MDPLAATRCCRAPFLVWVTLVLLAPGLRAQEDAGGPLRVIGLNPDGLRRSVTDEFTTLRFTLVNPNTNGRNARVVVFYAGREDLKYARDVWVPARSSLSTYLPVGPAPAAGAEFGREIGMVLYDRTDGTSRVVLPPGDERTRSRTVLYKRREQSTVMMFDGDANPDALAFAQLVRREVGLEDSVTLLGDDPLPLLPEAFEGVDVFVLAGNRLAADPPGRAELRRWVLGGGRLWVMLDRVDPETVAAVLGDNSDLGLVDRVGLTTFRLHHPSHRPDDEPSRDTEQPVRFARVTPGATDRILSVANGWPAAFSRPLGRGQVIFTTLAGPGWVLPVTSPAPKAKGPTLPTFLAHGQARLLALQLHPPPEPDPLPPTVFQPMIADEIGYSVLSRETAATILGGFVLAVTVVSLVLRRVRRLELAGWIIPGAAIVTAMAFLALGERSRRAVPPTIAVAGVAVTTPGLSEVSISGLFAVYNASSGPVTLGTEGAARFDLDEEGLTGQSRTRVQGDTGHWHWDGLSLPAGVRTGRFRIEMNAGRIAAGVRFGPNGLEGAFKHGSFGYPTDAIIWTQAKDPLAVAFGSDGEFQVASRDALPVGQYLPGAVLSDGQQRRQSIYRQLFAGKLPQHLSGQDFLLAWSDPMKLPITTDASTRFVGSVLFVVPLEYRPTPPGTRVTVPRGIMPVRRIVEDQQVSALTSGTFRADQHIRFQLPKTVLPLELERATLFARVRSPSRRFSVAGFAEKKAAIVFEEEAPVAPVRVEITDQKFLRVDEHGGLHLRIAVGESIAGAAADTPWEIETLSLEIVGRTRGGQ